MPDCKPRIIFPARSDHKEELSDTGMPQWFALSVKSRYEKAVAQTLGTKGFQTLVALYKKKHSYGGRCKEFELPLFPGYVFCQFDVSHRLPVLTTPGVMQILGNGNRPAAVDETEIRSLQTAIKARFVLHPFPFLEVGQKVRIEEGVLAGVEGVVIRLKGSLRLVLSVTLLQRSVLAEVDQDQVSVKRVRAPGNGSARFHDCDSSM